MVDSDNIHGTRGDYIFVITRNIDTATDNNIFTMTIMAKLMNAAICQNKRTKTEKNELTEFKENHS